MTERDILTKKLSSLAFAMYDIRLYLDTHPDSTDAMAKFDNLNDKFMPLKEQFEAEYGPLMSRDAPSPVQWIKGPWPWEVD
jgi:spore coat protein JB